MKKYITVISLIISFVSQGQNTQSQDLQNFQKAFPKTPVAPTTYSFIRQGEVPINEYTGNLSLSINLHTIESNGVTFPLNLNYVGGNGIKINEEASWVGLGWNLTIPTITQIVNDFDDLNVSRTFIRPDYFSSSPLPSYAISFVHLPGGTEFLNLVNNPSRPVLTPTRLNGVNITVNQVNYYNGQPLRKEDISGFTSDSEPDYFTINLFNETIKFTTLTNSNNQISFQILNKTSYKIEKTLNNNFKVTDDNGTIYYFEMKEEIYNQEFNPSNRNWMLTKIEKNNLVIFELEYDNYNIFNLPQLSQRFNYTTVANTQQAHNDLLLKIVNTLDYFSSISNGNFFDNYHHSANSSILNQNYTYSYQNYLVLKKIKFSNNVIDLVTSPRLDSALRKLDNIQIKDSKNVIIKNINFNYTYFDSDLSNLGYYTNSDYNIFVATKNLNIPQDYFYKRLKLESISNLEEKPYTFNYNSTLLPPKFSFAKDYWGYSNGATQNTSFIPNPIHFPGYAYIGSNNNDLRSNLTHCKSAVISSVKYPSGGETFFDYELNQADNFFYDYVNSGYLNGDGLRIKSITNKDNNVLISKKSYNYTGGKIQNTLSFFTNRSVTESQITLDLSASYSFVSISANNTFSSSCFESSSIVGYDSVESYFEDINSQTLGKEKTTFFNQPDIPFQVLGGYQFNMPSNSSRENKNGNILEKSYFNNSNQIVKKVNYEYNFYLSDINYGIKISNIGYILTYNGRAISDGGIIFSDASLYGCYPIYTLETTLKNKKTTEYFNNNPVESTTNYIYNSRRFLQSESVQNSDNSVLSKYYTYSFEKLSDPFMYELSFVNNNFSEIVEQTSYANSTKLYQFKNVYDKSVNTANVILPKEVYVGKNTITPERKVTYDKYDTKGNILQYTQENGVPVSFIWAYNQTYPVAKLENIAYSAIPQTLITAILNATDNVNGSESQLLLALNNLRNDASIVNAQVTSFTFKPLIGVSKMIDSKGVIMTYHYDNYNRLIKVTDTDNNIVTENIYNYRP